MMLAESLGGTQMIVIGLMFLVIAFVMRRGIKLGRRSRDRDVLAEVRNEMRKAEQDEMSQVRKTEMRLHEFSREIEGRIESKLAILDQLVVDADREIEQLNDLIVKGAASQSSNSDQRRPDIVVPHTARPAATADERRMIRNLANAGFSAAEIAHCCNRPVSQIATILGSEDDRGRTEAA